MVDIMTSQQTNHDWDSRAPEVLADQVAAYDDLRRRCPAAHSE
jgi:hypothetical protein